MRVLLATLLLATSVSADPKPKPKTDDKTACDAETPRKKGEDYLAKGLDMAALVQFQGSLRCKQDLRVVRLAYLAACHAKVESKAKQYFKQLPADQHPQLLQVCLRQGIDPST